MSLETVLEHAEGLVCLTGCAERGIHDEPTARRLLAAFGPEGLRVELQRPYGRHDRARNRALAGLARRLGVACVATGDVHAHADSRAQLQDAFVALRHHLTLEASEPLRRGNHSHVMSSPRAMARRFEDHPDAVRETLRLAERLRFDLSRNLGYSYPGAENPGAGRRLAELCRARLDDRYGREALPEEQRARAGRIYHQAEARLETELAVIEKLGLAGFFLLHHEILELARQAALQVRGPDSVRSLLAPGRGRGSSVSSIVCYLTGLSHIDPIENNLLLGRFLHEELKNLPDIDLDFPRDVREVLIPRVHERYGHDRAALVAAFPTFRSRGAIRELGKVLGLPSGEIERVARGAESWTKDPANEIAAAAGRSLLSGRWAWLGRLAAQAYGLPRHLSQHSGGMVVSTKPLIDCCPVVPAAMAGRQMVQWDKDSCADAGFLKIDLLGLGMLSAVERCVETILQTRAERIDLSRIPFDDGETFHAIRHADTVGVFQIESRAQMQSLKRTRPRNLADLTIQVAIVRPGPIQGGAVNPYIERLERLRENPSYEIPYGHPVLEEVLRETLGTIIFQDQVIEVAQAFAGFSPGEAEGLRRAMSRKRSDAAMDSLREDFLGGAQRHVGVSRELAERVWAQVAGFAGFGFPRAHAAAFGLLAYQSTWLRVHYGPEFLCALLNEQPMGFYAPDSLIHEAEQRGIPILGLDVNRSEILCSVQGESVRLGLGYIKGARADEMSELVLERERGGPFSDLGELAGRVGAGRATLEQLAWSGACDELLVKNQEGASSAGALARATARRRALWQLGVVSPGEDLQRRGPRGTQLALPIAAPPSPRLRPLSRWQGLMADYATSGVTIGDHVIAALRPRLTAAMVTTSPQLSRMPDGCSVTVIGLVIARQRPGTAGGTTFLLFEDEWGTVNLIVPRAVYERHRRLARAEPLLLARGRLERMREIVNVVVSELAPLEDVVSDGIEDRRERVADVRRLGQAAPAGADLGDRTAEQGAELGSSMRAVVPPMQSFGHGRRR